MVKEPIEDSRGDGAIAVEDRRPLFKGFVGCDNDRTAFVALANNLEELVGSALIGSLPGGLRQEARFFIRFRPVLLSVRHRYDL